jgi:hypothetical protein
LGPDRLAGHVEKLTCLLLQMRFILPISGIIERYVAHMGLVLSTKMGATPK